MGKGGKGPGDRGARLCPVDNLEMDNHEMWRRLSM